MKIVKKRFLNLFIMLIFIISLVGCGSAGSSQKSTTENNLSSNAEVNGELKVHYIDVGQADSILVQQKGFNMLIDAGNNDDSDLVVSYLKKKGVKKLDYIIGTHPHEDHIGGLDAAIKNFDVGTIYMPKVTSTTRTYRDVITAIKSKGKKITTPKVGSNFKLGDAVCTIVAPNSPEYKDVNNYSIVMKLKFGNNSFIFTGDAEDISEDEILRTQLDISADVLKVGHHGSSSSTTDAFLAKVNPKYAVISCGKDNDYGHPHKPTMDKLKSKNIHVYRTDECGTIVATSNGTKITFDKKTGDYKYSGIGSSHKSRSSKTQVKKYGDNATNNNYKISNNNSTSSNNTNSNSKKTVYFTQHGKSYHFNRNCKTLKRSKKVLQGTLEEAIKLGHKDPCNECAGGR
ncbi:ComEC/Rec2 family competence protein [Haloimpatiens sp. FM7330]|uniref:ComEC/Rec2 family competence protein n=1 Tax=Haloimpatiens sp. FM7330 TaxID=3298610 RepID=UPI00363F4125